MYRHFDTAELAYDRIITYSKVLKHDFTEEFPEIKAFNWLLKEPEVEYKKTPKPGENEAEFYRKKYEELLEKYNQMLERYNLLLVSKVQTT